MKRRPKRPGLTSVQIRPQVAKMLERFVKEGLSKSELINEALRQFLIEKEFQSIREKMSPYGQAKGMYSDEDVDRLFK